MPLTLVALSSRSALDLDRPQARRRVGREERIAGAGREDHAAALLEVAHRAPADVVLADFLDADRRHDACVAAEGFEGVLQRERVHDGREHAHVVGRDAVHAGASEARAAKDVAAADDDRDLDVAARSASRISPAIRFRIAGSMP